MSNAKSLLEYQSIEESRILAPSLLRSNVIIVRSIISIYRPLEYERVYLPLCKVADTPFHNQGDDILLHF